MSNFFTSFCNQSQGCPPEQPSGDVPVKMPFLGLVLGPLNLLVDNTKRFFIVGIFYSLILSILSMSFGLDYMCSYPQYREMGSYCRPLSHLTFVHFALRLFVICGFMQAWYAVSFQNKSTAWRQLFSFKGAWNSLFSFLLFIAFNSISLVALYMLYQRVPNPNWQIELVYFTAVGIWILIPFVLMRFYSLLAFVWAGEKLPSIRLLYKRSSGNLLRILVSLILLFFICIFFFLGYYSNFRLVAGTNAVYISAMVDILYNFLVLLLVALFVNHCYLQKLYLFGRNNNDQ